MIRFVFSSVLGLLVLLFFLPSGLCAQEVIQGEYVLIYPEGVNRALRLGSSIEVVNSFSRGATVRIRNESERLTAGTHQSPYNELKESEECSEILEFAPEGTICAANMVRELSVVPNDEFYHLQWALDNPAGNVDIDAPEAWEVTVGSEEVVIGVLDTGVDYNHIDLVDNMWINTGEVPGNGIDDDLNGFIDDIHGINSHSRDGVPIDLHGHGTHVAGTIAAAGNNQIGVTGVAWNVKIAAVSFLALDGSPITDSLVIPGMHYFIDLKKNRGVNLRAINASWGGRGNSAALSHTIRLLLDADIALIAAAGNEARNNDEVPTFPASYDLPNVISVGSMNKFGVLSNFSNFGTKSVDIVAPGEEIISVFPFNEYRVRSGTSMAVPHVTGAFALLGSQRPHLNNLEIRNLLLTTGKSFFSLTNKIRTESLLNINNALRAADPSPRPLPPPVNPDDPAPPVGSDYEPPGTYFVIAGRRGFQSNIVPGDKPIHILVERADNARTKSEKVSLQMQVNNHFCRAVGFKMDNLNVNFTGTFKSLSRTLNVNFYVINSEGDITAPAFVKVTPSKKLKRGKKKRKKKGKASKKKTALRVLRKKGGALTKICKAFYNTLKRKRR